jgi:acyl-CoA synthetase (AMP-forming)/AMP-acid ligase II
MSERMRELVEAMQRADAELTAPGAPFETHEEVVLGERMLAFRDRPTSLGQVVLEAPRHGDRPALVMDDGTTITFEEMPDAVARFAARLRDVHGIGPGDRVGIWGANSLGWLLAFWATTSIGAVAVAMNGWWTSLELQNAVDLTEPSLLLADAKRRERLPEGLAVPVHDLDAEAEAAAAQEPGGGRPAEVAEDDLAMLLFTSGTTGRPKAAMLSHRSVIGYCHMQAFLATRGLHLAGRPTGGPPMTRLGVFPLFHVSGMGTTVTALMSGGTTVWMTGRFDAGKVIRLTKEHGITAWGGTTTHVMRLLEHPDIESVDPSLIRSVGVGGSASTPEIIRRTEARFPHLQGTFSSGYGSTESGGLISYATNAMLLEAVDCVGPPLPTVEVKIVDGEICARSPLVMLGYYNNPEANEGVFLPGRWVRTGDFGRLENGAIFLAARLRDLILRGGENIYPFEIENRLDEHPDVVETAVFGVDHAVLGQEVKAVVVLFPGSDLTEDDVREWCAQTLSSYKVPAHVELRTEPLPRNATGKILKHVLAGHGENTFVED